MHGHTVILDVGKSWTKASLWTAEGRCLERRTHPNARVRSADGLRALDVEGIESWLCETLSALASRGVIEAIVPVAHGAGAAILRDGALLAPPLDYEQPIDAGLLAGYEAERDSFRFTGSPRLPDGLNLGAQLHFLEACRPGCLAQATLVTWAQYWAWSLCGIAATEVTSLGCHTDLWLPGKGRFSDLAVRRGWDRCFAPLRRAHEVLGTLTPSWSQRTGLLPTVRVHCGLHDSNAALLAARGFEPLRDCEATVLSTGTWFVAMRSTGDPVTPEALPQQRDCLMNVDVQGRPVPSARFMGGREIETLLGQDTPPIDGLRCQCADATLADAVASAQPPLPGYAPGCGPFPAAQGQWPDRPADPSQRQRLIALYAALVADASMDLLGVRERVLVEGRFSGCAPFVSALAALRPGTRFYTASADCDASFGALRLVHPSVAPAGSLTPAIPLERDLRSIRNRWRERIAQAPATAGK